MEKTDLKVGVVRDTLAQLAPRRMGSIWSMNREPEQWAEIKDKQIFALSSACDKKEYNPPIRRVAESFAGSLFHLAETNDQLPEDTNKGAQIRFEKFVNSVTHVKPTFLDFRNSKSFEMFEEETTFENHQGQSTPVNDELEYEDYELNETIAKRYKY